MISVKMTQIRPVTKIDNKSLSLGVFQRFMEAAFVKLFIEENLVWAVML